MKLKFLFPLIGLSSGILLSDLSGNPLKLAAISLALALVCWSIIFLASKNIKKGIKIAPFHSLWIFLLFCGIGSIDFSFRAFPYISSDIDNLKLNVTGKIDELKTLANGERIKLNILTLKDSTGKVIDHRNVNFLLTTDGYTASKGDIIEFSAIPHKVAKESDKTLIHQGVEYTTNIKSDKIKKISDSKTLSSSFSKFRESLIIKIENSYLQRSASEFIISFLLGDKSMLKGDVKSSLTSAGMAHILALSGMHIAIITSIFYLLFFPFALLGYNKTRRILVILLIWLYVLLTGGSPGTVRAAIMATMVVIAILFERKNSTMNSLLVAAVIILIIYPLALWDIGFQLSLLCVASIILFVNKLNPVKLHYHPNTYRLINAILVTLITTFATWILIVYYFHSVPLLFLPSNLILLPLLPFFTGGSLIYVFLLSIGIDFTPLAVGLNHFYDIFIKSVDFFSDSGKAVINIDVNPYIVFSWLGFILLMAMFIHSKRRYMKLSVGILGFICLFLTISGIISMKEADVTLIKFPHSFTKFEIHSTVNNKTDIYTLPRRNITFFETVQLKVTSIDKKMNPDSLHRINTQKDIKPHYLLLGPESDVLQMAEIINKNNFTKVILHSGVGKRKKTDIISLLNEEKIESIYSLRENGSLEFSL